MIPAVVYGVGAVATGLCLAIRGGTDIDRVVSIVCCGLMWPLILPLHTARVFIVGGAGERCEVAFVWAVTAAAVGL